MNDFEARLRNSLRHNLDPIDTMPYLPDEVTSRARARRFIMTVGAGLAVVLLAASTVWTTPILLTNLTQRPVTPGRGLDISDSPSPTPPNCPPVGEGGYQIELSKSSGTPGTTIRVTGPTPMYAKDGSYSPPDGEVQLWWNADPEAWESLLPGRGHKPVADQPGEVFQVGTAQLAGTCTFRTSFTIPDVAPGHYRIVPVNIKPEGPYPGGAADGNNFSATFFGAHASTLEVVE